MRLAKCTRWLLVTLMAAALSQAALAAPKRLPPKKKDCSPRNSALQACAHAIPCFSGDRVTNGRYFVKFASRQCKAPQKRAAQQRYLNQCMHSPSIPSCK